MRVFNDFSDLSGAVGTEVGDSDWMEIPRIASTNSPRGPATSNGSTSTWSALDWRIAGGKTIAHGLLSLSLSRHSFGISSG